VVCSVVTPTALCSTLIFSQPEPLSRSLYFVSDNNQQQHLILISYTMANNLLPHPNDVMAVQHWEQPTDLPQAKSLLGRLCSSITHRARNAFFLPPIQDAECSFAYPHRLVQNGARNIGEFDHLWTRQRHSFLPSS